MAGNKLITYITYIYNAPRKYNVYTLYEIEDAPPKVSYRRKILVYKYIT